MEKRQGFLHSIEKIVPSLPVVYFPLHLVCEDFVLKSLSLQNDEMKARVQPKDLSFDLPKTLIFQGYTMGGAVLVTCLELPKRVTNDRNFLRAGLPR